MKLSIYLDMGHDGHEFDDYCLDCRFCECFLSKESQLISQEALAKGKPDTNSSFGHCAHCYKVSVLFNCRFTKIFTNLELW